MLRINHDGCSIKIKFYYGVLIKKVFKGQLIIEQERRYTDVKIIFPDYFWATSESRDSLSPHKNSEFQGRSICHPSDNFCKSIGRKLALANAITGFDRDLRTAIWREYHKHCK